MKRDTIQKLAELTDALQSWCESNGLPHLSADELACDIGKQYQALRASIDADTAKLKRLEYANDYLEDFICRWHEAQNIDDVGHIMEDAGFELEVCGGGALMWHRYGSKLYAVISGEEGDTIYSHSDACTLCVYDPDDGGDSIMQADYHNLHAAIRAAALLVT